MSLHIDSVCLIALAIIVRCASANPLNAHGRIIGGAVAEQGQFPYQISLRSFDIIYDSDINDYISGYFHRCGGSILNERWTISAAHCTQPPETARSLRVVVGAHRLRGDGIEYKLDRVINHPAFSNGINDICLMQTKSSIEFGDSVQPIAISRNHIDRTASSIVSGWGHSRQNVSCVIFILLRSCVFLNTCPFSQDYEAAEYLRYARVRIISNEECLSMYEGNNAAKIRNTSICTFKKRNVGTCYGDSGGPLKEGDELVGLVSWGVPCAVGRPDVFTRISEYIDWIVEHTGMTVGTDGVHSEYHEVNQM